MLCTGHSMLPIYWVLTKCWNQCIGVFFRCAIPDSHYSLKLTCCIHIFSDRGSDVIGQMCLGNKNSQRQFASMSQLIFTHNFVWLCVVTWLLLSFINLVSIVSSAIFCIILIFLYFGVKALYFFLESRLFLFKKCCSLEVFLFVDFFKRYQTIMRNCFASNGASREVPSPAGRGAERDGNVSELRTHGCSARLLATLDWRCAPPQYMINKYIGFGNLSLYSYFLRPLFEVGRVARGT